MNALLQQIGAGFVPRKVNMPAATSQTSCADSEYLLRRAGIDIFAPPYPQALSMTSLKLFHK